MAICVSYLHYTQAGLNNTCKVASSTCTGTLHSEGTSALQQQPIYSRGHRKVPVPCPLHGRATVTTVPFPFPFRVHVRTVSFTCTFTHWRCKSNAPWPVIVLSSRPRCRYHSILVLSSPRSCRLILPILQERGDGLQRLRETEDFAFLSRKA